MRRTKAEAEETRLRLLDVAERLFYERGPAAVTMEQVACAAGVTRGAIYWHFSGKADLLRALYDLMPMPAEAAITRALEEDDDAPLDLVLKLAIEALADIAADEQRQRIYSILFRCDYRGEFLSVLERERETSSRRYELLVRLFDRARAKGQISANWPPRAAAKAFHWMFTGLLLEWLKDPGAFALVEDSRDTLEALVRSLRA